MAATVAAPRAWLIVIVLTPNGPRSSPSRSLPSDNASATRATTTSTAASARPRSNDSTEMTASRGVEAPMNVDAARHTAINRRGLSAWNRVMDVSSATVPTVAAPARPTVPSASCDAPADALS